VGFRVVYPEHCPVDWDLPGPGVGYAVFGQESGLMVARGMVRGLAG
jgi:hypothetical protein